MVNISNNVVLFTAEASRNVNSVIRGNLSFGVALLFLLATAPPPPKELLHYFSVSSRESHPSSVVSLWSEQCEFATIRPNFEGF
jgi:hypothetical protein